MASLRHLLLPFFIFTAYTSSTAADPLAHTCDGDSYMANRNFESNLKTLLSSLSSSGSSFNYTTVGSYPDTAYGLILCRGDTTPSNCDACIKQAAGEINSSCSMFKRGTVWYDNCQLRYDDRRFFSAISTGREKVLKSIKANNETDENTDDQFEAALLYTVAHQAANISIMMYGTAMATYSSGTVGGLQKIYALAQCTRDLTKEGCWSCFQLIWKYYASQGSIGREEGVRIFGESCNLRYDSYHFFQKEPQVLVTNLSSNTFPSPVLPPTLPPLPGADGRENLRNVLTDFCWKKKSYFYLIYN